MRKPIISLVLSAAGLVGIVLHEGYRDKAYIPLPGDKPTIGFGETSGVKLGDTTTPTKALAQALRTITKFEGALKRCVSVPLTQNEYDAYLSLIYNIGDANFCSSTLVKKLNKGDYPGACAEILRWNRFKDQPNAGLTERRKKENELCLKDAP